MSSAVVVKMPEALDARNARKLGRELKSKIAADTPLVVLDLSRVKDIDLAGIEGGILLHVRPAVRGQDLSHVVVAATILQQTAKVPEAVGKAPQTVVAFLRSSCRD